MSTDIEDLADELFSKEFHSKKDLQDNIRTLSKKYKTKTPGIHYLNTIYKDKEYFKNESFEKYAVKKACRNRSGINQVSIMSRPRNSCEFDCHYCPNEPGMPRSYVSKGPSALRASRNEFNANRQFLDRVNSLNYQGLVVDKLEIIVLGGTWTGYPWEYQEEFIRDIFYSANTFIDGKYQERERKNLEEEQYINETAEVKIIGLTIETRPDQINLQEIRRLRYLGVTRVQLGLQHTDNRILKKINRGHTIEDSTEAMKLLKYNGFKIITHFMPDLLGSSPEKDIEMFKRVLLDPLITPDEIKIYPTMVTEDWSIFSRLYKQGRYKPYTEENPELLNEVILYFLQNVPEWMRIDRIVRDIPTTQTIGGINRPNLRQDLDKIMKRRGIICKDIRMREVKDQETNIDNLRMDIQKYDSSQGKEVYIQYISGPTDPEKNNILHAHCRLRLNYFKDSKDNIACNILRNTAIIREVHVYGKLIKVNSKTETNAQHRGLGKKLIKKAEEIAYKEGYLKIAVISGVGVRRYYQKLGYTYENTYMVKNLYKLFCQQIFSICFTTYIIMNTIYNIYYLLNF